MIRFGAWSTLLGVLAFQCLVLSAMLASTKTNQLANRYLALVLLVIGGMLLPYVLGYAGAYDAWPWLTAAPFAIPLALGPLLYAHVTALVHNRAIALLHFLPAALQFTYQTVLFPFPVATKWWWDGSVHEPYISPVLSMGILVSMAAYATMCWLALRRYEAWLAARRRDPRPARRIRVATALLAALLATRAAYELFELLIRPTDYFDMFAFYILLALVGLVLGFDGWRNGSSAAPAIHESAERDWAAQGEEWLNQLREQGWWRDAELDLPQLARLLGTNTAHLSRALNAGHGGLASALGAMRSEAVAAEIERGTASDLLTIALSSGFGSKASFNRAFQARFGVSPSTYRAQSGASQLKSSAMSSDVRRRPV